MTNNTSVDTLWTTLKPPLPSKTSQDAFVKHARALETVRLDEHADEAIEKLRAEFIAEAKT